ncbi:hypothetical protein RJ640_002802 [Escallonia rubra]|uniref:WPP domain-containing protein n=1 Tax=Escallonia rubra TaxID=112253 RepID=A0AA88UF80_9ASTE|nr:hypothetical protein RJ640_002802 [Escallonia rubra]
MAAEAETLTLDSQPPQSQPEKVSVSFSIWPPTQRTHDAVLSRLIETLSLSAASVLSKRYGPIPADEATAVARHLPWYSSLFDLRRKPEENPVVGACSEIEMMGSILPEGDTFQRILSVAKFQKDLP